MKQLLRLVLVTSTLFATACLTTESYDDTWGEDAISDGKADGLFDSAPLLRFGTTARGSLRADQLSVYALDLKAGDAFTAVQRIETGDLAPHFTLYAGLTGSVRSTTFSAQARSLTKTYVAPSTGRFYVGVRPYQGRGAGDYSLTVTCTGGPCAGQVFERALTFDERNDCLNDALDCSLAALPSFGGVMGPTRARQTFERCLAAASIDDATCAPACADDEGTEALCDDLIAALPFYADQSAACLTVVGDCMSECRDLAEGPFDAESIDGLPITMCWRDGFNGSCDGYARALTTCGGDLAPESNAACHAHCESTTGAWYDDLDTLCTEACDE